MWRRRRGETSSSHGWHRWRSHATSSLSSTALVSSRRVVQRSGSSGRGCSETGRVAQTWPPTTTAPSSPTPTPTHETGGRPCPLSAYPGPRSPRGASSFARVPRPGSDGAGQGPRETRPGQPLGISAPVSDPRRAFRQLEGPTFVRTPWRRRWDLNPRKVSLHTISNRADSAALALLQRSLAWARTGYPEGHGASHASLIRPRPKAAAGSRATAVREPSQGWKPAALSGSGWVPRIAWPSLWASDPAQPPGRLRA